jgi:hypothetical protein
MVVAAKQNQKFPFHFLSAPPNPLPFCPPERKLSKVSVRIFAEKSSDFVQDRQPCAGKAKIVDRILGMP